MSAMQTECQNSIQGIKRNHDAILRKLQDALESHTHSAKTEIKRLKDLLEQYEGANKAVHAPTNQDMFLLQALVSQKDEELKEIRKKLESERTEMQDAAYHNRKEYERLIQAQQGLIVFECLVSVSLSIALRSAYRRTGIRY
jgi:predicted  nucleic acid-binding Zn-ribbon protein